MEPRKGIIDRSDASFKAEMRRRDIWHAGAPHSQFRSGAIVFARDSSGAPLESNGLFLGKTYLEWNGKTVRSLLFADWLRSERSNPQDSHYILRPRAVRPSHSAFLGNARKPL
jgi:hypothetical protein